VVDEYVNRWAIRRAHFVLWTIPTEDHANSVHRVDVRANRLDAATGAGHDRDIDPALVVAVNQHDVAIDPAEKLAVETHECRPILGFDDPDDVGTDVLDDLGGTIRTTT
jgi:hypothetical protein